MISIVLVIFMFFLADLVLRQATVGKLDRLSYSIAGVLRERVQLYSSSEELKKHEIEQIYRLAQRMLNDMNPEADTSQLKIQVEQLFFAPRADLTDDSKHLLPGNTWMMGVKDNDCHPPKALTELKELSPRGSYGRWVPLYQVTLCLPTNSWFKQLTQGKNDPLLMSSSSTVMLR